MRGLSIRALAAAALWLSLSITASADDDDRDIIRLLPPGAGKSGSEMPSTPDLAFPPGGGGNAPGQGLRLSGKTVTVPITFQPWPGKENLSYVGLRLDGVNDPALASTLGLDQEAGVFVVDTTPGAPAAQAGLRFGDFVTAFDGKPVTQTNQFVEELKARAPGSQGTLTVWRVGDDGNGYLQSLRPLADRGSTVAISFRFVERIGSRDLASERGIFQIVSKRADGDERTFYGRFHTYARRIDERWRICVDYDTDERSATLEEEFLAAADVDDVEAFSAQT